MPAESEAKIVLTAVDNTGRAFAAARQGLSGIGTAAATVKTALAGIGAVAAASYLASMVGETKRAIDGFKDLSDATGSSVENVSALDRVARATGGSFEQVSGILVKFNQVLQEADPTKGAGAVLKSLNLDIAELKRLDPAEALRRTAMALNEYADDGEKARAVQVLFGKSVREAAPFLKDLAESGKLVATVTSESADEVDRFNKQLALIQANAADAGRALSIGLITEINKVIDRFKVGQQEGKSFLEVLFASDAQLKLRFSQGNGTVGVEQRLALVRQIKEAESRLRQFQDPSLDGSVPYREQLARRQAEVASLRLRLRAFDDAGDPANETGAEAARLKRLASGDRPKPQIVVSEKDKDPEKKGLSEEERARLAALKDMERTLERIAELSAADVQRSAAAADSVYESNQALREEVEYIGLDDQARIALLRTKEQAAIKDKELLLLSMQTAGAEAATIANLEREINLRRQRAGLLEEQGVRVKAQKELEDARDRKRQEDEENKRRSESLSASIEDGVLNGFRDGKSASAIFLNELKAQFGRAVLRPIIDPIVAGGMSGVGDFISSLLGSAGGVNLGTVTGADLAVAFDGGGYTGNGARAGGLDGKGGFMAMLHPQETVVDHTKGQALGGAAPVTVIQNFTVGDVASIAMVQAAVAGSEARIVAGLSRSARYGGAAG